jgi:hypothetical protein
MRFFRLALGPAARQGRRLGGKSSGCCTGGRLLSAASAWSCSAATSAAST